MKKLLIFFVLIFMVTIFSINPNIFTLDIAAANQITSTTATSTEIDLKGFQAGLVSILVTDVAQATTTVNASVIVNSVSIKDYEWVVGDTENEFMINVVKNFDYPTFYIRLTPDAQINYSIIVHKYNEM